MGSASQPLVLDPGQARRIFLHAQGLSRRRPRRRPRVEDFFAYLERQGVLQLDSVNVLVRAHYMPLFSRLGAYDREGLDACLWEAPSRAFEHWGHEASVLPRELLPAMHARMVEPRSWQVKLRARLERERPGLIEQVLERVSENGPLTAAELQHLSPREGPRGPWWDNGHVKNALEYAFITGAVAASRRGSFRRTYDLTERAWGLAPASSGSWGLPRAEARQRLFDHALSACGIGTPRDLADHFRLVAPGTTTAGPEGPEWAASAVERGLARWVEVEGWSEPALLATGAEDPGRATAAALLSPFDPVCWFRPRLLRMFGVDYRIEIYTPAPERRFGYYCLLFLLGDQLEARVDLRAERKQGTLRACATWREPGRAPNGRRRSDGHVAGRLAEELRMMAAWLGLGEVSVDPKGDLAGALSSALS